MRLDQDTIVAISTPQGRGGIGIVRLSGPESLSIAQRLLRLNTLLTPSKARFTHILDEAGEVLDEAVVTFFGAPHSYTTEDVVEIAAHGAPVLLSHLVESAIKAGARLAEPGEFTQRAFLAGRLDLTQAEAVHDLIAAQTLHQAKTAAAQLGGAIARAIAPIKQRLVDLIAALEAGVDFAEDDLDLLPDAEVATRIAGVEAPLQVLARTYNYGRILRVGVKLAIVGAPNAGKSSLFNRLLERDRAIVTAHPGTTRDPISERLSLNGIPVELTDTAGLRDVALTPETEAERAGIERSRTTLADADLVLHVVDASTLVPSNTLRREDEALRETLAGRLCLLILNKSDLNPTPSGIPAAIHTSALTGEGLDALRRSILDQLDAQPATESAVVTSLRQSQSIAAALAALGKGKSSAEQFFPHEFLLLDLHEALQRLDELTGATTPDAVLALIFSTFCIGK
jgi:tRNA modification GTPase